MNLLILGFLAAIVIVSLSSLNWRTSVKLALVILIFEGALRKWALPQGSVLIYFLKDFVLLGSYLGYFVLFRKKANLSNKNYTITVLTAMAAVWCIFQAFNPSLGSPIIGMFGLKNYLIYIPLMWMMPDLFPTIEEFYKFLRAYLLLIIPVGLLAILQYFSPTDSILNVYSNEEHQVAVFGFGGENLAARVTGTFSYIAGYSTYLGVSLCLLLPMMTLHQPKLWRILTIMELMLVAVTSFMTGARGLIATFILVLLGYFIVQAATQFEDFLRTFQKFTIPTILACSAVTIGFSSAVQAFWYRVTSNQDVAGRITGGFAESFSFFTLKGIDGYGTGATFQANPIIRSLFGLPSGEYIPVYYEGELGRIALELGPVGFFLWYGFKLVILIALGMVYLRIQRTFLRQLALSAFWFQAISFTGQLVFNHTAGLYHWFFNGLVFLLPHLEQIANFQQYQQQLNYSTWKYTEAEEQK